MANFKINENVIVKATGQTGVIKCRETQSLGDKRTKVSYLVKVGDGFENYKVFSRKELSKASSHSESGVRTKVNIYEAPNGYKLTLVAMVYTEYQIPYAYDDNPFVKTRNFRLGYSIYNPTDEYDENVGYKIARHRAKVAPFCNMTSRFLGEFNEMTVEAIMDAKSRYIVNNFENFINR